MKIIRKLNFIILLACFITSLVPVSAAKRHRYISLDLVSGLNPDLELLMHEKSFNLDLSKTQNIRVRVKVNDLYKNVSNSSSFKVNVYEIIGTDRKFVSSQNLTVKRGTVKSRILALDAGYFASPVKNIEIDVFDTVSTLVNTYEAQLMALNIETQVLASDALNISSADCDSDTFDDCHLDYLFQKITFEAKPQRQISTRVLKGEDGLYKVTIPVPRSNFNYLGRKLRKKKSKVSITNNSTGGTTTDFSDTINVGSLNIGDSLTSSFNLGYENSQLNINDSVYLDLDGRLGIGVEDPLAWLHITGGDSTTPSLILNPGTLTDAPIEGALEFDGTNLYFTKGGSRATLGATGPQGPQGPAGATGATGPAGTAATINGSIVNGSFTVTDTINARLFNGQVFNGGIFNGTFYGDGSNLSGVATDNGSVINLTIENGSFNDASLNGNTSLDGDLTVNGTVFADEFNGGVFYGNGIGLTNINASAIIGVINNTTITNGSITNANLNNSTLNGTTTIDGPVVFTNNGFIDSNLLINGNLSVDEVHARLFNGDVFNGGVFNGSFYGDGSNLTGLAGGDNGEVHDLTINNGTLNNVVIQNGSSVNDSIFGDNELNGTLSFLSNGSLQDAVLNGDTVIQNGTLQITLGSPGNGKVLTSDALGNATWETPSGGGATPWTDVGVILHPTSNEGLVLGGNSIGTATIYMDSDGTAVFNKQRSTGSDFRVAGNGDAYMIQADVSANNIGMGYNSPTSKLHVNGQVLALALNGTHYGDGSNLSGVATNNGQVSNLTILNSTITNSEITGTLLIENGVTTVNNGSFSFVNGVVLDMNGARLDGPVTVNGDISADTFTGGTFTGTFSGNGSGLTGVSVNNGTLENITINNGTVENTSLTYNNGDVYIDNGTVFNFTNGSYLQDATLNGTTSIVNGSLFIRTSTPSNGYVLSSDANGLATWVSSASLSGTGDDLGNHTATTTFNMSSNKITNATTVNGVTANFTTVNATNFVGGTFNGTFLGDGSGLTGLGGTAAGSNGYIQFNDGGSFAANGNLYWDVSNLRLALGHTNPDTKLDIEGAVTLRYSTVSAETIIPDSEDENTGGSGTIAVTKPTDVTQDDLMIAFVYSSQTENTTYSGPAGWSTLTSFTQGSGSNSLSGTILYKIAGASEGASYTFTPSNAVTNQFAYILNYDNADTLNPIGNYSLNSGTFTQDITAPNITTTRSNSMVLRIAAVENTTTNAWGSGFNNGNTMRSLSTSPAGFGDKIQASAGATGTATTDHGAMSSINFISYTIEIHSLGSSTDPATPDNGSTVFWRANSSAYGNDGDYLASVTENSTTKVIKIIDFNNGRLALDNIDANTIFNGLTLNGLTASSLVATNASKELVSETNITVSSGKVGIGSGVTPSALLDVGGGTMDIVDGTDDLLVKGDAEIDGTVYATTFNGTFLGDGSGLTGILGSSINADTLSIDHLDSPDGSISPAVSISSQGRLQFDNGAEFAHLAILNGQDLTNNLGLGFAFTANGQSVPIYVGGIHLGGNYSNGTFSSHVPLDGEISTATNWPIKLLPNGVEKVRLTTSGNMGIGFTSPATKLAVNGDITADSFIGDLNADTLTFTAGSDTSVAAATGVTVTKSIMKINSNGGAVTITANPQIADGSDGQLVVLKGLSDTNTITFIEGNGLSLTDGLSFTIGSKDTLTLIYDSGDDEWIELSRSDK